MSDRQRRREWAAALAKESVNEIWMAMENGGSETEMGGERGGGRKKKKRDFMVHQSRWLYQYTIQFLSLNYKVHYAPYSTKCIKDSALNQMLWNSSSREEKNTFF